MGASEESDRERDGLLGFLDMGASEESNRERDGFGASEHASLCCCVEGSGSGGTCLYFEFCNCFLGSKIKFRESFRVYI